MEVRGSTVYIGSTVNVNWMGVWYDGTVIKLGPQNNLFKVLNVANGQEILIEPKQLKQLDSKFTLSQEKQFAFNDGDSWFEVQLLDSNFVGSAKVSWRKNVHSQDNETWFEIENIAPVIQDEPYKLQADTLSASRSGLLPVKGIEQQSRTVENVVYQTDSEPEQSSEFHEDITLNTEIIVPQTYQSTPIHAYQNSIRQPETLRSVHPPSWEQPPHSFVPATYNNIMPPSLLSRVAPKPQRNITQSSMPCVWSYNTQCANGIAPHYASKFFHRLRKRKESGTTNSSRIPTAAHKSDLKFHSQSQKQTMERSNSNANEEIGRRHSLYDQFLLHKDERLHEERTKKKLARRTQAKIQGFSPEIASVSPGIVTAGVGENILLACTATGTPPIEYKWLKDGDQIPSKVETTITYPGPGLLQLNEVSAQEEGIYSCEVSNIYGSTVRYFNLSIKADKENEDKVMNSSLSESVSQINVDKQLADVQEYLDGIVDEFKALQNESEYDLQENADNPSSKDEPHESNTGNEPSAGNQVVPKISVTKAFNNEMEQYLFGYGENYGQSSSTNIETDKDVLYDDHNSVEVHTSLDSSQSEALSDDDKPVDMHLPKEVESVYDQVQRFHSSIEQNEQSTQQAPQKKWFNRIFSKKK